MTSYTTKGSYPYPDPTDAVTDYPSTASTFAGYVDNLPNRNRIINGQFDIWQRGTSFPSPATGAYTADRWRIAYDGAGGTRTVSQTVSALNDPIGGMQALNYLTFAVTNAGTATTQLLGQRVEDVRTFAGETATLSVYVKSASGTKTITARAVQNFGTGGSPSSAVTTSIGSGSATTSWTRLSWTFSMPSISGKTIGTTGDDFVEIQLDMGSQTGTVNFWGAQLEQGSTRTALEREPIQQTLAKCQRYYFFQPNFQGDYYWSNQSSRKQPHTFPFPVEMRIVPTLSVGFTNIDNAANGGQTVAKTFMVQYSYANNTSFNYYAFRLNFGASAEL